MIIYLYHAENGVFLGESIANESPREPGVYLLPAFATYDAPPSVGEREIPVFCGGAWRVVPDWRGVPLWDITSGEAVSIGRPGTTPEEIGATDIEHADPATVWDGAGWVVDAVLKAQCLLELRTRYLAAINAERDQREEAGFPYRGKTLDSTPRSVQRLTAASLAAQAALATGLPFAIDWTCADNSVLSLDAAGVIGMPVALAQHAAALHSHARSLKAAVDAAMNGVALAEIDIQAGWPGGEA